MLFFNTIEKLKTTTRKGWVNEGIENPESIADHMFRMATMTMLCTDQSLDRDRMVKLALVHDMAEARKYCSLFRILEHNILTLS